MRTQLLGLPLLSASAFAATTSLSSLTSSYGLTSATYNFTPPTDTLNSNDADNWVLQNWDLNGKIQFGNSYMSARAWRFTTLRSEMGLTKGFSEYFHPIHRLQHRP